MEEKQDLLIRNCTLLTEGGDQAGMAVGVHAGKIFQVGSEADFNKKNYRTILDAEGAYISPGLIDSHTHGGIGLDFMTASEDEIRSLLKWYASKGVTGVMPTLSAGIKEIFLSGCETLTRASSKESPGAKILGIHIEGPFISKEKKGAQPVDEQHAARIEEIDDYLKCLPEGVCMMTLAPEIQGSLGLIDHLVGKGVICSVGHSNSTYEDMMAAAAHGLTHSTHTFNAMSGLDSRTPGVVGAVMVCDEIYAELTLDGYHVHPGAAKALVKAKGFDKVVLVTDSINATGLGDGEFIRPGNRRIWVKDGAARLESGNLAGSVLTLNRAVVNAVEMLDIPLATAIAMASHNAARSLGCKQIGVIRKGYTADLILHDADMHIHHTIVDGCIVFSASN